jgi:carbon monoxide dehydrogenase subunit G
MLIEDKFVVKAPVQTVWDFIVDPNQLGSCIPGLEKVDQIDDRTYNATVKIKVGPIEARFKFTIGITEMDSPKHLKATAQGADIGLSKGGSFSMEAEVNLKELSKSETELAYRMVINIIGRFATFGERIIRAKAKEVGMKFMQTVQEKIEIIAAQTAK